MAPYRPPGRSGRSGRSQADNDIFEGLPVKQWSAAPSRISLALPAAENAEEEALDKWADPPMPRDYQLLLPHTQQLLRIARSGRLGIKRKATADLDIEGDDFGNREEDGQAEELTGKVGNLEDRGFVAKKWRPTPESALVPEHRHWEFLAKRRNGLPSFYNGLAAEVAPNGIPTLAKRRTRVQKVLDAATGDSIIYEVLALEGQVLENELPADSQMPAMAVAPGITIEGLGTADEDGLINMIPTNPPVASRRNRPPPKKKGGPGRGKKRVTFTNPDGSTYTTIVPNATKIVPQPGQTVKHVAKGEEAGKDVSIEEAAKYAKDHPDEQGVEGEQGEDDGEEDDEGDDEGDDDDDREEGEIPDDEPENKIPGKESSPAAVDQDPAEPNDEEPRDVVMSDRLPNDGERSQAQPDQRAASSPSELPRVPGAGVNPDPPSLAEETVDAGKSGSEHSQPMEPEAQQTEEVEPEADTSTQPNAAETAEPQAQTFEDGEEDLLGSLERHLQ